MKFFKWPDLKKSLKKHIYISEVLINKNTMVINIKKYYLLKIKIII